MRIDNPRNRYHYVYQRRVDRFTILALIIMTVAATLGFGWMTPGILVATVIVYGFGGLAAFVVLALVLNFLDMLYHWLRAW